jgi:hypothetical protein
VTEAAIAGAHVATLPFKVLQQMVHHPLTDKGIKTFREDWEKARKTLEEKRAAKASGDGRGGQRAEQKVGAVANKPGA